MLSVRLQLLTYKYDNSLKSLLMCELHSTLNCYMQWNIVGLRHSMFHYCNFDSSEASVITSGISRAKRVGLLP